MSIDQLVDALPAGGLTVSALKLLDFVVPGQWDNLTGFDNSISRITGETDPELLARVRERALVLYNDPSQSYERAISIYHLGNASGTVIGLAAAAHKLGETFGAFHFLESLTPRPEKAQAVDLAMKIVAESAAWCYTNGLPGDSISDFAGALEGYGKDNLIRIAAIVAFDGLIPLGDAFASKLMDSVGSLSASDIEENAFFQRAKHLLPGDGLDLVTRNMSAVGDYIGNFASAHGMTSERIVGGLRGFIDLTEDKMEYLGAVLDISLNYMEHTGTQSVARSLIERAVGEV